MKPFQGCYYLGAYRAFASVEDAFLLIHSVSSCSWGALALHQMGRADSIRQGCTMMHQNEIIFGGERKLRDALEILKEHAPARAYVLNGCPSDMIHDDIQAVIDDAQCPFPVYWMNTAGYCGSMRQGYIDAMCFLARKLPRCERKDAAPSVNLVGISLDDFRAEADVESIRRMLEPEVKLNATLPMLDGASMERFGAASLNIVFQGFEAVGEALKEALGIAASATESCRYTSSCSPWPEASSISAASLAMRWKRLGFFFVIRWMRFLRSMSFWKGLVMPSSRSENRVPVARNRPMITSRAQHSEVVISPPSFS